jgi:hypothetical protein
MTLKWSVYKVNWPMQPSPCLVAVARMAASGCAHPRFPNFLPGRWHLPAEGRPLVNQHQSGALKRKHFLATAAPTWPPSSSPSAGSAARRTSGQQQQNVADYLKFWLASVKTRCGPSFFDAAKSRSLSARWVTLMTFNPGGECEQHLPCGCSYLCSPFQMRRRLEL